VTVVVVASDGRRPSTVASNGRRPSMVASDGGERIDGGDSSGGTAATTTTVARFKKSEIKTHSFSTLDRIC